MALVVIPIVAVVAVVAGMHAIDCSVAKDEERERESAIAVAQAGAMIANLERAEREEEAPPPVVDAGVRNVKRR